MGELTGDDYLEDDEYLTDGEQWVRHRLERVIGRTRVIDRRGGRQQGKHDLEAELPGGKTAAIEITSEADEARLSAARAAQRHLSNITVPGSQFWWHVQVTPEADMRALGKPAGLVALLTDMEKQGESNVTTLSDYRNPWRARLKQLGIQSVLGLTGSSDRRGAVSVTPDVFVGWGWVRLAADKWITDFLATELGQDHLAKLTRVDDDERHLVVLLYPDTYAGLGIAAALGDMPDGSDGDDLPSEQPPAPLTHLWLVAPTVPARAFRWAHDSGWAVVDL